MGALPFALPTKQFTILRNTKGDGVVFAQLSALWGAKALSSRCTSKGPNFEKATIKLPRPPYPTPVLGYLTLYLEDARHKARYLEKGVGYTGPGTPASSP